MSRNVCITAVEGNTGYLIAELLLTDETFSKAVNTVTGLTMNPDAERCKDLSNLGVSIVPHLPGRKAALVSMLLNSKADTICLVPPAHGDKIDITQELIDATKEANIPNAVFLSAAGCDMAERDKQPRLREFIDLEAHFMQAKGDVSTKAGHSPVIIRSGFYAENLLLYAPQAQADGILPIPVGTQHKFAPVALGDVALLAAHVLSGQGKNGFHDNHRGQLMVMTGPMLLDGHELAKAASQALGAEIQFENISEYEAKKVLKNQSDSGDAEIQFLLEYYSLVREGKTNYVATSAFREVTGDNPQRPPDFFKVYAEEFAPKKASKKRKVEKIPKIDEAARVEGLGVAVK